MKQDASQTGAQQNNSCVPVRMLQNARPAQEQEKELSAGVYSKGPHDFLWASSMGSELLSGEPMAPLILGVHGIYFECSQERCLGSRLSPATLKKSPNTEASIEKCYMDKRDVYLYV